MLKYILILNCLWFTALLAQWEADIRLTVNPDSSITSFNNAWCISTNGDIVHTIWADNRDGIWEIYYKNSSDAGISWGLDLRLTNAPIGSIYPSLTVSGGFLHIAWMDGRDGNPEIYYKRSTDGGASWSGDTRLTDNLSFSAFPCIASIGSTVYVVWEDDRDGNYEIYYKKSTDNGSTWGTDTRLTYASAYSGDQVIALSGLNVHIAWYDERDGNSELYYKRSTNGGVSWSADTRITIDPGLSQSPCIAASGSFVHIFWDEDRDLNGEVYYIRSTNEGAGWEPPIRLTYDSAWSWNPSVAVSNNNVHVVWCDDRDGNQEIYYNRSSDAGISWGTETRLTNAIENSRGQSIAVADTIVHVLWHDYRDNNWEIYYKRNPNGNIAVKEQYYNMLEKIFYRSTLISAPINLLKNYKIYDITGKYISINNIIPGVYFIEIEGKIVHKIVKIK